MDVVIGSCTETREELSAYLEGELTGLRGLRVRLHLAGCSACSAVLRSLQRTVERLHGLGESLVPGPSPSVTPAVLERIQKSGPE